VDVIDADFQRDRLRHARFPVFPGPARPRRSAPVPSRTGRAR
jgi:hypothetical protein